MSDLTLGAMIDTLREFEKAEPAPPAKVSVSPEAYEQIRTIFAEMVDGPVDAVTHFAGIRIVVRGE